MAFFKERAVVKVATDYIAAHLRTPQVEPFAQMFVDYCRAIEAAPNSSAFDKFMVQVSEQLKVRQVKADALVLYTLRYQAAARLQIAE